MKIFIKDKLIVETSPGLNVGDAPKYWLNFIREEIVNSPDRPKLSLGIPREIRNDAIDEFRNIKLKTYGAYDSRGEDPDFHHEVYFENEEDFIFFKLKWS